MLKPQKAFNSQNNPEKKEQSWWYHILGFQIYRNENRKYWQKDRHTDQ